MAHVPKKRERNEGGENSVKLAQVAAKNCMK